MRNQLLEYFLKKWRCHNLYGATLGDVFFKILANIENWTISFDPVIFGPSIKEHSSLEALENMDYKFGKVSVALWLTLFPVRGVGTYAFKRGK